LKDPENKDWVNYSIEFCGGTHLKKTEEAKLFHIVSESGVAKGILKKKKKRNETKTKTKTKTIKQKQKNK